MRIGPDKLNSQHTPSMADTVEPISSPCTELLPPAVNISHPPCAIKLTFQYDSETAEAPAPVSPSISSTVEPTAIPCAELLPTAVNISLPLSAIKLTSQDDIDTIDAPAPLTVEWRTTRGPESVTARDFSVHVGLVDRGNPAPTDDSIDPLHFMIADALDVVSNTWHLRGGPGLLPPQDHCRFDELTEQTLQAVCKRNLERPFVLKHLRLPTDEEAHTWTKSDNDGTIFMRQAASVKEKPSEVASLAKNKWCRGRTATLSELTNHLDNTASYLERQSEGSPPDLSIRSNQSAKATASVLPIIRELKPNAVPTKQWTAMEKWNNEIPVWKPEQSKDS
jgi:hypothetical protein